MEEHFIPVFVGDTYEDFLGNPAPPDARPVLIPVNLSPFWKLIRNFNERHGTTISIIGYTDVKGRDIDSLIETMEKKIMELGASADSMVEWISEYKVGDGSGSWQEVQELRSVKKSELVKTLDAIVSKAKMAKIQQKSLCFLGD